MNRNSLLIGAGCGMALAFILDPDRGRRRRALVGDRMTRVRRKTRDAVDSTARDLANRATGFVAATRGRLTSRDVDDTILVERVRAKLGRVSSHPRAIDIQASEGEVTLSGMVLADEVDNLLRTVAAVPGVQSLRNGLESHESADGVPSLQGTGRLAGPALDVLQRNWAPATQALAAAAGLAATGVCLAAYARR